MIVHHLLDDSTQFHRLSEFFNRLLPETRMITLREKTSVNWDNPSYSRVPRGTAYHGAHPFSVVWGETAGNKSKSNRGSARERARTGDTRLGTRRHLMKRSRGRSSWAIRGDHEADSQ